MIFNKLHQFLSEIYFLYKELELLMNICSYGRKSNSGRSLKISFISARLKFRNIHTVINISGCFNS